MIKKIYLFIFTTNLLISCAQRKPKDFISLQGNIENNKESSIAIVTRTKIIKEIEIKKDGSFKDTLKVTDANIYTIQTSVNQRAPIYLKNGFDLTLKVNSEDFFNTFSIEGDGADNTNYFLAQSECIDKIGNPNSIFNLEKDAFTKKINSIERQFDSILAFYKNLDSTLIRMSKFQNQQIINYFNQNYTSKQLLKEGSPSPEFENYLDYKGGKKSLSAFKGTYVYIDLWATWCGPCIMQIPFLQSLEKEYHNKKIAFVSISTDETRRSGGSWEAAEKKWRDFVKERALTGIQLWAGQDISFQQAYQVTGIPRFILLDKDGKIIDANAPRPSEPALKELLETLDL